MEVFSPKDIEQINRHGLTKEQVQNQLKRFVTGTTFSCIESPATVDNGIVVMSSEEIRQYIKYYETRMFSLRIKRFVPASGAATRMFQELFTYLKQPEKKHPFAIEFLKHKKQFAFYKKLQKKTKKHYPEYALLPSSDKDRLWVKMLLGKKGLYYGSLPKALVDFHSYKDHSATAFEEQLYEAAQYSGREVAVHFTVSENHLQYFQKKLARIKFRLERSTNCSFNVEFSFQKKETDTIAVDQNNLVLRDERGQLIFRPSGHGALIENLNDIDADLIFIKNIDNVAARNHINDTVIYKKALAGLLLKIQKQVFRYVSLLEKPDNSPELLEEIRSFINKQFFTDSVPAERESLHQFLNRPIRVCGMVRNTGQPGGGPFWVKNASGKKSLQIVELAQIDIANPQQREIVNQATHFNPVDLVCGVKNFRGEKFHLKQFVDPQSDFISEKSFQGKTLKALELPGLWNGAMAGWISVFAEVPQSTFNPVKTINDLLKKPHQQ